jgi:hypothetical protein
MRKTERERERKRKRQDRLKMCIYGWMEFTDKIRPTTPDIWNK